MNPKFQLNKTTVNRLAVNILENGSATEATQFVNELIAPVMNAIWLYQNNARMLAGNGAGSEKLTFFTRNG